jgi:hypothetical protein
MAAVYQRGSGGIFIIRVKLKKLRKNRAPVTFHHHESHEVIWD